MCCLVEVHLIHFWRVSVAELVIQRAALIYHWRELTQVSFLSGQNTCFVSTKVCLSRQNFINSCLSRQNSCHNKMFCRDKHNFVATNITLSRQAYFCCDKRRVFVATKVILAAAPANARFSYVHCPSGYYTSDIFHMHQANKRCLG